MEVIDKVFVGVEGFLPSIFLGEKVGVGRGGGCVSLYDFVSSIVVRGSVCVVWDVDRSFGLIDLGIDFF